ncbi:hypothetical protein [Sphingobium sp. Ant17]|uniref:hypothetical protein n=1 Tax=Sphingobium sp. Ant17 TaxID=1461752 RepID=UPI000447B8E0|nr:hypothetical protein [Sphingobium sp. Ant17]EXS68306.1 hypothetical protein BF95_24560 [Sphingobium sp. Ant17]
MSKSARHKLMQALLRGSTHYGTDVRLNHVEDELSELGSVDRAKPVRRQRLLKVIHAARAIDTTLGVILDSNGLVPQHGIGNRLAQLKSLPPATRGYMDHPTMVSYRSSVASVRNKYAHTAGAFPTATHEVDSFVSEVHACMALIL